MNSSFCEYEADLPVYGDVMTVGEFQECCEQHGFKDSDGYGYPVKNHKMASKHFVIPSQRGEIPSDATHVIWFNK